MSEDLGSRRASITRVRAAYRAAHGRDPALLRPRRFSEKMQWRKLFDHDPRYATFCDKLATREFVAARFGWEVLPPLLWAGDLTDLPLNRIAPPYVLKSSHASGHVILVEAGATPDIPAMTEAAAGWLGINHGLRYNEPGYATVPPRLMIERIVTDAAGNRPEEIRVFVFDGRAAVINTVFIEQGEVRNGAFHRPDWTRLDWHFSRRIERPFPPPQRLAEMIAIAEALGQGLDHVRVDFFDGGARFWVGEMTLYSWSGHARFNPDAADFALGRYWRLRQPWRRAAWAMLAGEARRVLAARVPAARGPLNAGSDASR